MLRYLFTAKYVDTIFINIPIAIIATANRIKSKIFVDDNIRNSSFSIRYTNPTRRAKATIDAIMP